MFLKQYATKTKKQIYLCNMGKKLTDKERDRMIEVLSEKYKFLLSAGGDKIINNRHLREKTC